MVTGDIIEIVSRGEIGVDDMLNVYHLRATDVVVPGGDNVFKDEIMDALLVLNFEWLIEDMQPWAPPEVRWHGIDVRNLFNPAELGSKNYASDYVGGNATQLNAQFVNPKISSTRKIRGMHGGRKALAPASEAVSGNNSVSGGLLTSLGVMASKWNNGYTIDAVAGVSMELTSVIVKRVRTSKVVEKTEYTYELPTSQAQATYYIADNWKADLFLGSQNSRKPGRGG